jgi:AcrR family transcriptional regulator
LTSSSTSESPLAAGETPTEKRIRRAAVTLFARHGYAATGIRDIANAAGMTSAALYHYTRSKEELLVGIMVDGHKALTAAALRELEGRERPEHRLGLLVGGLVAGHATNPLSTRVIDTEIRALAPGSSGRSQVIALRDEYEALWAEEIERGRAEGVFDVAEPHLARLALLTMCSGMSNWYRRDASTDLRALSGHFVDLALGSLHATRSRRRVRAADIPPLTLEWVPLMTSEPVD